MGTLRRASDLLDADHRSPAPAPAILTDATGPRPAPAFVEWLMGLPSGWETDARQELTTNSQITALGNGVVPRQAVSAISSLLNTWLEEHRPRSSDRAVNPYQAVVDRTGVETGVAGS